MFSNGVFLSQSESYKFQIINKYLNGKIYKNEAALLLRVSERTISRYASKVKSRGIFGVKHGNSNNKYSVKYDKAFKHKIIKLFQIHCRFSYNLSPLFLIQTVLL